MSNNANGKRAKLKYDIEQETSLYRGFFQLKRYSVRHDTFSGGEFSNVSREVFLRGSAVGVLLIDVKRQKVILVEQFRIGAAVSGADNPWLLELVAGIIEPNEKPDEVAIRESIEETGCRPYQLIPMYQYWVSPGGSDEVFHLFCGLVDASKAMDFAGLDHENEDIRVHQIDFSSAFRMLQSGELNNAITITGLQWLMLNRDKLLNSKR